MPYCYTTVVGSYLLPELSEYTLFASTTTKRGLAVAKINFGSGIGGTMSTMIREQDGFITIYDHKLKKLRMSRSLLNIAKRSLPKLMLGGNRSASKIVT